MDKKVLLESLLLMQRGITNIVEMLNEDVGEEPDEEIEEEVIDEELDEETDEESDDEEESEDEDEDEESEVYSQEEIDAMSFSEVKELCKENGVDARGKKEKLIEKLIEAGIIEVSDEDEEESDDEDYDEDEESESEDEEDEEESDEDEEDDEEDDSDEEEEDEDEDEEESLKDSVEEQVKDWSIEELASFLESAGISPKGKREALIDKLVKGIEDGQIEFSGEDDEDEDEEEIDSSVREDAVEENEKDLRESFKNEELDVDDLKDWLIEYNGNDETITRKIKKMTDKKVLDEYVKATATLIDDDGELHEEGMYYVDGEPYCCGHPLKEVDGKYVCEYCGTEYEA
jgi:hypothetical protein